MAYSSLADLTDRLGERTLISLTDRGDPPLNAIDTDVVDQALADADALIDGYLSTKYKMPLSETPPLVLKIARVITLYELHVYSPDDKITADHEKALRQLKDIGSGAIKLSVAGVAPADTGGGGARITDRERPMTEANLKGFI